MFKDQSTLTITVLQQREESKLLSSIHTPRHKKSRLDSTRRGRKGARRVRSLQMGAPPDPEPCRLEPAMLLPGRRHRRAGQSPALLPVSRKPSSRSYVVRVWCHQRKRIPQTKKYHSKAACKSGNHEKPVLPIVSPPPSIRGARRRVRVV